jgi:hypothetical protein
MPRLVQDRIRPTSFFTKAAKDIEETPHKTLIPFDPDRAAGKPLTNRADDGEHGHNGRARRKFHLIPTVESQISSKRMRRTAKM